ncbi:pyridoxal phosphate-dependent decarboxylase family protein [Streptomyces sp. L7]
MPADGTGAEGALARFAERWAPGFSGSAGPRYLGFVTGGATPASVTGDWLTSAYDQNVSGAAGSWAAALERETVGRLRELFGLGEAHSGAFVTGAGPCRTRWELAVAREWPRRAAGRGRVPGRGRRASARSTCSPAARTPASPRRCPCWASAGTGCERCPCSPGTARPSTWPDSTPALAELGGRPTIVVANSGTVNTVDFDDLRAIAALKERHDFWLHVDAAFGGFAALSPPTPTSSTDSTRRTRSASTCTSGSTCPTTRPSSSPAAATCRPGCSTTPPPTSACRPATRTSSTSPRENSRRLRALPAWFSLLAYGRAGHREIVERNVALAHRLGEAIAALPGLRLSAPVRLNVVCFTLADNPTQERVAALAEAVAATGEAFLTPTVYDGTPALRAAFSNWRTSEADTDRVLAALGSTPL